MSILQTNMLKRIKEDLAVFMEAHPKYSMPIPDDQTIIFIVKSQFKALRHGIESQEKIRLDGLGTFYMAEARRQELKKQTIQSPKKQNLLDNNPFTNLTAGLKKTKKRR